MQVGRHFSAETVAAWRRRRQRKRRLGAGSVLALLATTAGLLVTVGGAGAGVTSPTPGQVIREEGSFTITEAVGGLYTSNLAAALCNGSSANRSPQASGRIRVIRASDDTVVLDVTHVTPNALTAAAANANAPYSVVWNTAGEQPGTYRILSTAVNSNRASALGACSGTPVTLSDFTVEYRPWQKTFRDILGTGKVGMNTTPEEVQWTVKGRTSPVVDAASAMTLYGAPDTSSITLPEDPQACLDDPQSCLPPLAVECTGACQARFAVVNWNDPQWQNLLVGLFDLDTGAFIALARAQGTSRVLLSLGPDLDAAVTGFLGDAIDGLSAGTGIDLANILGTVVRVRFNGGPEGTSEIDISLAELITGIYPAEPGPTGVNLLAPFSLGVGQILHTYSYSLPVAECATPHAGYVVTESQLVPSLPPLVVPAPPPLLVLEPGGTLKHVEGDYPPGTGSHSVGDTAIGPEIDTAPDAPSGLPVWLPLVDSGTVVDSDIDFVGHAIVVSIPEIRIDPIPVVLPDGVCIGFGLLIGSGVALFGDNPLPVGLGALPLLWDAQDPAVLELIDAINGLSGDVLANPAVGQVLGTVLGLLAGGSPDPAAIVELLSDFGTIQSLVDAVVEAGGLDGVAGLSEALAALNDALAGASTVEELLGTVGALLA